MLQFSTPVWNAMLDALEATIGASPVLQLRTGNPPATADVASTGTVIATMILPADWLSAAAGRAKSLLGTWQDTSADATGTVQHFEIRSSGGTPGLRGTVTLTGAGGDITLDQVALNTSQSVSLTSFSLNAPSA